MIVQKEKVLISACLLGVRCRYDGGHTFSEFARKLRDEVALIPVCPEQLGGLPTPRPAAQITSGDGQSVLEGKAFVLTRDSGEDVSDNYIRGAEVALKMAHTHKVKRAFLKTRSPSCGCGEITRDGSRIPGDGVTTALLKRSGITVIPVEGESKGSEG